MSEAENKKSDTRLFAYSMAIIGTLSLILWGILWSTVSASQERVSKLEGDRRVIEEQLRFINEKLDRIETKINGVKP